MLWIVEVSFSVQFDLFVVLFLCCCCAQLFFSSLSSKPQLTSTGANKTELSLEVFWLLQLEE